MAWIDRFCRWRVIVHGVESGAVYEEKLFLTRHSAAEYQDLVNATGHLAAVLERAS